jgi:hypothetical protein
MKNPSRLLLALAVLLAAFAAAEAGAATAGADLYRSKTLTDNDFLLYFQYMELSRLNVGQEAMASFAQQNDLEPAALAALAARIEYGRLIIENPTLAESLAATHGPAVNPSDQERILFDKYAEELILLTPAD